MQLNNANNIIEQLKSKDLENCPQKLKCWIKDEGKYNIYIFSILIKDEKELLTIKDDLRDYIAIYFQCKFPLKNVERWNIYQIYFCEQSISVLEKRKLEEDKYATRKIVIDKNIEQNINEEKMSTLIYNEIFKFEFEPVIKTLPDIHDYLSKSDIEIIKLTTSVDLEKEEELSNLVNIILQ